LFLALLAALFALRAGRPWEPDPTGPEPEVPAAAVPSDFDYPQLLKRLEAEGLGLHVVAALPTGDLGRGFYLSERPHTRESIGLPPRIPAGISRWAGVVYVEPWNENSENFVLEIEGWGACGLRAGRLILFGDPRVLGRIRRALEQ
jgi:hypothetical protein